MRISRRDNRAAVERTKVVEAGYKLVQGSRTYRASVYAEEVSDAAFLLSGESGFVDPGDLLPDLGFARDRIQHGRLSPDGLFRFGHAIAGRPRGSLSRGRAHRRTCSYRVSRRTSGQWRRSSFGCPQRPALVAHGSRGNVRAHHQNPRGNQLRVDGFQRSDADPRFPDRRRPIRGSAGMSTPASLCRRSAACIWKSPRTCATCWRKDT